MVVGITGTDGAGKGTVVDYLVKEKGFVHYSSRTFLVSEIEKEGIEVSRNEMRLMGNKMRAIHGDEFIAKRAYELIAQTDVQNAVIESIRATAEADYIKSRGGVLLAVDADEHTRFGRVQVRRSESDKVSFEQFVAHETLEKNDPDPHGMQKAKVMEMSDYIICNDGTHEELEKVVDEFLKQYDN
jgi:dephospho-CoA kinase